MSNLEGMYCYLVGPIDKAVDLGQGWRETITPFLKSLKINVINPLKKPIFAGNEGSLDKREERAALKENSKFNEFSEIMKRVRAVDLRFVDKSDFLIVNLDLDTPMCGTFEEIALANSQRKPVLIMCERGKKSVPDWMFGQLPHRLFFSTWESLRHYLWVLNISPIPDTMKDRWLFFDQKENL